MPVQPNALNAMAQAMRRSSARQTLQPARTVLEKAKDELRLFDKD